MKPETPLTNSSADILQTAGLARPRLAVLDSGVGGLPYLAWIHARRPVGSYIYLADTAGFPYGSKGEEEIIQLVTDRVQCLTAQFEPDLFLIACNTASVVALPALRERFSTPFVGVVPAVKPAAQQSRVRKIGLIATSETVVHGYTNNLIARHAADCSVFRFAGQELVDFVENRFTGASRTERLEAVRPACEYFRECGVDNLVLGCTHFLHLREEFQTLLGPDLQVIDSVDGVGREVLRRLSVLDGNIVSERGEGRFEIYTTSSAAGASYHDFASLYGAHYQGVLTCQ